ncbi:kinase-like domain-containing protein [Xylaria arbuscula]|nr:kinase-like domain-containing protein [Xylaria arbuscula]
MSGTLSNRLESAMIRSAEGANNWFIPHDQLNEILDRRSVTDEVTTLFYEETPQQLEQVVDRILGQGMISQGKCRKIFAVLVMIRQARSIKQFIDKNISDADIPLKSNPEDKFKITAFHIRQEATLKPEGWSNTNYRSFLEYQWFVDAPVFTRDKSHDDHIPILGEQTIFPWIPDDSLKEKNRQTGHSEVRPIKIHESHHDFVNTYSRSVFALKKLHKYVNKSEDKTGVSEIEILRKFNLEDETNLIQLLTAYCWNDDYYLIFPWANGGSLEDLWESNSNQRLSKELVTWVSDQCHGVAKGLYQIHERKLSDWSRERLGGRLEGSNIPGDMEFGLHGDIKPANILWFKHPQESIGAGVLKISDFGLAQFHSRETHMRSEHSDWIGCSPSYRPPEWVPMSESGRTKPYSRKADIWGLGCVFLEFVTWILLGTDGIEKFADARIADDRPQARGESITQDIFFEVDAETSSAIVKNSVKQAS